MPYRAGRNLAHKCNRLTGFTRSFGEVEMASSEQNMGVKIGEGC